MIKNEYSEWVYKSFYTGACQLLLIIKDNVKIFYIYCFWALFKIILYLQVLGLSAKKKKEEKHRE